MNRSRWLLRTLLTLAAAAVLPSGDARALIVEGGSSVNTTSAGFNSIFSNVGSLDGGSAVYLGDGWALTAQHVTIPLPGAYVEFVLPNGSAQFGQITNTLTLPQDPDLELVRLATAPSLPSIYQNISTSQMSTGSVVAMVGDGAYAGTPLYWNSASASASGVVNLGSASASPATPVTPIPSDTYWTSFGTGGTSKISAGTYQDAGFSWSGRELQWGESVVSFVNQPEPLTIGTSTAHSTTFVTTFYNPTYDPPTLSSWAAEVNTIGSNMSQVATGDSGGGAFVQNSNGSWSLAGTLAYTNQVGSDRGGSALNAAYGDLSYAIDLSQYVTSIQNIVTSTASWTGQTGAGATSSTWDNATSNWANAASNGTTTFASGTVTAGTKQQQQGNAIFSDTNPLYGIHLNNSLGTAASVLLPQSVVLQASGVSAYSVTFSNTGAANGGTDFSISNASGLLGISGTTGITLSGNGAGVGGNVYLTSANSFTGPVRVYAGQLVLENATAMGDSAAPAVYQSLYYNVVGSGAAIDLQTTSATTFGKYSSSAIGVVLYGNGINGTGALNNLAGNNTYYGPITLASAGTIGSSSTTSGDQLSLTGGVNMGQANALTFTGAGNTVISGTAFTSTFNGSSYGAGTVIKTGSGNLTLNFNASGSPASNLLESTSPLTVGGGTFAINGASSGTTSQTFASLAVNSGATEIQDTSNSVSSNLIFTSGTLSRSVGGTVDFSPPTTGSISFTATPALTGGILGGWATANGSSWATLSGNNVAAYSGATSASSGVLSAATNYDLVSSIIASGGANSLRLQNGATTVAISLTGSFPLTTGGILVPASVTSPTSISGGTLQGASGADLIVVQNSSQPLTIGSTIANNGAATGLTKSGTGALTLTTGNSYSGITTLNAGTLDINNASALGSGAFAINGGTIDNTSGSTINTTNSETWNGSFTFQGTNPLTQSSGAITIIAPTTITVAGNTNPLTIGGNIAGGYGLKLAGTGTLVLSGNNTFTGGVTINGGTLLIGGSGALNSTSPNVVSFGTAAATALNLGGNNVSIGGLSTTSTSATVAASSPLNTMNATLTINGVGIYSFAGTLSNGGSGALSLVKSGTGTQFLSGADSYTGTTTIDGGVLEFASDTNLPVGSAITVNSAGTAAASSALDQTFLSHIAAGSVGAVALGSNSANNLSFSGLSASLGSTGNYLYSGTLTPNANSYLLGGGGGLLTLSGTSALSGANSLNVLNGGFVALTNMADSYSLGTTISAGTTLLISSDSATAGSNAELGVVPNSAITNITLNGGTLEATSSFALNSNRTIVLGTAGGTIDVNGAAPSTLVFGGIIADSAGSAGGLTLTDTGTLVLSGPNTYTGATTINSGILSTAAVNTIPQMSAIVMGLGGTLLLNSHSQSVGSLSGGGIVTNNSSTAVTLTIGNDNTSPSAFYGVLSDTTNSSSGKLSLAKVGSGTITFTGLNTYSGGTSVTGGTLATLSGGVLGPGALQISATSGITSAANIGTSQSVASLTNTASAGGSTTLTVAAGDTITSTGALTNTGTLAFGTATTGAGTVLIDSVPTLNSGSKLQINAGTVEFNATSGTATVGSGVTVTVAAGATLQLAGSVSALTDGSAVMPTDGQEVNITNNGSLASGGSLSVTGTHQGVGVISGTPTTSGGATTYAGDTVVAAGASLTATQILQNSLTIGAGATVTIAPSAVTQTQPAGTSDAVADSSSSTLSPDVVSIEVTSLQSRISRLEQLEEASTGTLDPASPAAISLATSSSNPSLATSESTSTATSATAAYADEIDALVARENLLLASEGLSPVTVQIPTGGLSLDPAGSTAAVPEPSSLLLAAIGAGLAIGLARRRSQVPRRGWSAYFPPFFLG